MTELGCYKKEFEGVALSVAKEVSKKVLCLPLFNSMAMDELNEVCDLLENFKNE